MLILTQPINLYVVLPVSFLHNVWIDILMNSHACFQMGTPQHGQFISEKWWTIPYQPLYFLGSTFSDNPNSVALILNQSRQWQLAAAWRETSRDAASIVSLRERRNWSHSPLALSLRNPRKFSDPLGLKLHCAELHSFRTLEDITSVISLPIFTSPIAGASYCCIASVEKLEEWMVNQCESCYQLWVESQRPILNSCATGRYRLLNPNREQQITHVCLLAKVSKGLFKII